MHRSEIGRLDCSRTYWVPAVVAPERDWAAAPGCRKGSRFLVNAETLSPSRDEFGAFDSQLHCLSWIMSRRSDLNRALPGVRVRPVPLDRWLLGLE